MVSRFALILAFMALVSGMAAGARGQAAELLLDGADGEGGSLYPIYLVADDGPLYFQGWDATHAVPSGLYVSDHPTSGTGRLRGFKTPPWTPGQGHSNPVNYLTASGDRAYFIAHRPESGFEPWISDGTAQGTTIVSDITPGPASTYDPEYDWWVLDWYSPLFPVSGGAYLRAQNQPDTWGLWKTDGTSAGTALVAEPQPDGPGFPETGQQCADAFVFVASDSAGRGIWRTAGTPATTERLAAIEGDACYHSESVRIEATTYVRNFGSSCSEPSTVWRSDGTAAGTYRVFGATMTYPRVSVMAPLPEGILIAAYGEGTGGDVFDLAIYKSAGLPDDGTLLADGLYSRTFIPDEAWHSHWRARAAGGLICFSAGDDRDNIELWGSDGSGPGTALVKDINPAGSSYPTWLIPVHDTAIFVANDGTHGREIWRTDGTEAGTLLIADVMPGPISSEPWELTEARGSVFFSARLDPANAGLRGLWCLTDREADGKLDRDETADVAALSAPSSTATNIHLADSDGDGLLDGHESPGGAVTLRRMRAATNPRNHDTDGDGWLDGLEVRFPAVFPNGPLVADVGLTDADGDGLPAVLDPHDGMVDSDNDRIRDDYEAACGSGPADSDSRPPLGDVNGDGALDVDDVAVLANWLLGNTGGMAMGNADTTGNGIVDLSDLTALANSLVGLAVLPSR